MNRLLLVKMCALAVVLSGCSIYERQANVQPIAEQAGELIAKVENDLQVEELVLLIRYVDSDDFSALEYWEKNWSNTIQGLRDIGRYSIELIDIAGDNNAPDAKQRLAANVGELYGNLRQLETIDARLTGVDLSAMEADIERADDFLDAAKATQGAIKPVVRSMNDQVAVLRKGLDEIYSELLKRIDDYHRDVINYQDTVARARSREIALLELFDKSINNRDKDAWQQLRKADLELEAALRNHHTVSPQSIKIADEILYQRLERVNRVWEILQPDFALYQAEMAELKRFINSTDSVLTVTKLSVEAWDRGHTLFVTGKSGAFATYTSALLNYAVSEAPGLIF